MLDAAARTREVGGIGAARNLQIAVVKNLQRAVELLLSKISILTEDIVANAMNDSDFLLVQPDG